MKRSKKRSKTEKRTCFLPLEHRKFRPFGRNFRPFGRNFRWAEIPATGRKFRPSVKTAKSFLGFLPGGVPELLPGSSPRKFPVVRKFRPLGRKFRPWKFLAEFWLSHFGFSSREGSRRFWAEILPGDFRTNGSSGRRPEVPVLNTGNSGPALFQWPDFLEGYLYPYPSTYLGTASSCNSLSSLKAKGQIEEISQSLYPNSLIF